MHNNKSNDDDERRVRNHLVVGHLPHDRSAYLHGASGFLHMPVLVHRPMLLL